MLQVHPVPLQHVSTPRHFMIMLSISKKVLSIFEQVKRNHNILKEYDWKLMEMQKYDINSVKTSQTFILVSTKQDIPNYYMQNQRR